MAIDVREGERVLVWLPVRVIREDILKEQVVTLELFGQRLSGKLKDANVVKHEKGNGWSG